MASISLLCTIGIPGAGKTTFCEQELLSAAAEEIHMVHICYDELVQMFGQTFTFGHKNMDETSVTPYKLFRYSILRVVEFLIKSIKSEQSTGPLELMEQNLVLRQYVIDILNNVRSSGRRVCLVIDDNMYYRSMRYPYYQLARKYSIGYGQLYFDSSLERSLAQNRLRSGDQFIDESVIVRMKDRLESPDPSANSWEIHSFTVTDGFDRSQLRDFLHICFSEPVQSLPDTVSSREESMRITAEHVVHQSDLILRQLVKQSIEAAKSAEGSNLREIASVSNTRRRDMMSYMKSHSSELSGLLTDSLSMESATEDDYASVNHLHRIEAYSEKRTLKHYMNQ